MRRVVTGLILTLMLAPAFASGEEEGKYKLQRGDTVRLQVLGLADLALDAMIDVDGNIVVPYLGPVVAAGKTVEELHSAIASGMDGRVYRFIDRNSAEAFITIRREDVQVVVAEYRPITVYGAVANPGEIPFRAGMTVRDALARSGAGRSAQADDSVTLSLKAAEIEGDVRALMAQRDHELAVIWRLHQEMERLGAEQTERAELSPAIAEIWADRQNALLERQVAAAQSQIGHLSRTIERVDERLEILAGREDAEAKVLDEDTEEKRKIDELFQRGIVSNQRISDIRKSQLVSATRLLQTQDAISSSKMDRMELERARDQELSERLIAAEEAIEKSELEVAMLNGRIAAGQKQLSMLGVSVLDEDQTLILRIHRTSGLQKEVFPAALDDLLRPGDTLEVSYTAPNR